MQITEEAKKKLFSMESMAKTYGATDEDFGRFMRGFEQGMIVVMGALGINRQAMLPIEPPDEPAIIIASFVATYASFLNSERRPRIAQDSEDHEMLYGHDAQAMMAEAEKELKEYKRAKRKKGMEH